MVNVVLKSAKGEKEKVKTIYVFINNESFGSAAENSDQMKIMLHASTSDDSFKKVKLIADSS